MKNYKIILLLLSVVVLSVSCDKDDANSDTVYDNVNGQLGLGFTAPESPTIIVPVDDITVEAEFAVTTLSTSERSFDVSVNNELTDGAAADYTLGTINIPANSYTGSLSVTFSNFNNLPDLVVQKLVVDVTTPANAAVVGFDSYTFNYLKYIICNDLVLVLNEDTYADERTWEIADESGAIVAQGGPYPQIAGGQQIVENINLADGCYTFTILDSFSDGQFDGNVTGNYSLDCSIINHAAGEGNWGGSDSTEFCVNP
jgi:hypothetical protein